MKFSISDIVRICNAEIINGAKDNTICRVFTDSRETVAIMDSMFIALDGPNRTGASFIKELADKGFSNFLVNKNELPINIEKGNILAVNDTLIALQQIAKAYKQKWCGSTIGITGSNGKTSVKEWLSQLLNLSYKVGKNPGSYNSQLGVPLSILKQKSKLDFHILEAGISTTGEMQNLEEMMRPDIGIFTHFGSAHSYGFKNNNDKLEEKFKLFKNCNKLFINEDQSAVLKRANIWLQSDKKNQLFTFSLSNKKANLWVEIFDKTTSFNLKNKKICIDTQNWNTASIHNISLCILAAYKLGIGWDLIEKEILHFNALPMRLQLQDAINQNTIINDTYSNDLDSLEVALKFLNKQAHNKNKALILGDIVGQSDNTDRYESVIKLLNKYKISKFVGIGKELVTNQLLFRNNNGFFYPDIQSFLGGNFRKETNNTAILIKGAHKENFAQIVTQFSLKEHQTILEISLGKLAENFNFFRNKVSSNTKMLVMVKAFSYGSGIAEVARLVQTMGANYLAVAYADEGVELRKLGISLPIMVLNVNPQQFLLIDEYNLEPVIYSKQQWLALSHNIKHKTLNYHLEFDTGMKRLGFSIQDIDWIVNENAKNNHWNLLSVFSHLSSADDNNNKEYTQNQISEFENIYTQIQNKIGKKIMRHICNTAGILNFSNAHLDMVRLGIGLYGYDPTLQFNNILQPAVSLKTYITQIRTVNKGESVGYSRGFISNRDTHIGIIPIGYADGLFRSLGNNNANVYIKGIPYPIIGNICMDMCMIDLGNNSILEETEVVIFENNDQLEKLAKAANTIPYEILTSFGPRLKRVYLED